jgi:rod shape-determining protein MreC
MMLSSANVITGHISSASNVVFSYLNLQTVNQELLERNILLEAELIRLQSLLDRAALDTIDFSGIHSGDSLMNGGEQQRENYTYEYLPAGVVNNSVTHVNNYITINKGADDGIRPDMGVVSPRGVAGIVVTVRERYSVVISLLNSKFKLSCKVKNTGYFGALTWKSDDLAIAYLEELPSHATFQVGDTVVTSGYSAIFPPGVMVGVVEAYGKQRDDNFYSLKVRLATDFRSLSALCVIVNRSQDKQREIEREAIKND